MYATIPSRKSKHLIASFSFLAVQVQGFEAWMGLMSILAFRGPTIEALTTAKAIKASTIV
ncbi:hypothetical protein OP10G_0734 [Fimbriimonas ginsengisoli Gsoil 348]|uniref:Uncharacterized protein n=1 Tax=Fimbriimonas ginsengisoli Gsoil 348 TaxID=661478 RepID=A0A068NL18_FIMGI|nr:hypothetical protein OP10G_0734 [Fimbriimonas ginsengisoli Gsoil 348]